jgi:hypothetical protein
MRLGERDLHPDRLSASAERRTHDLPDEVEAVVLTRDS